MSRSVLDELAAAVVAHLAQRFEPATTAQKIAGLTHLEPDRSEQVLLSGVAEAVMRVLAKADDEQLAQAAAEVGDLASEGDNLAGWCVSQMEKKGVNYSHGRWASEFLLVRYLAPLPQVVGAARDLVEVGSLDPLDFA